jgi:predicted DNA-binding transcriptional regulator YafY
MKLYNLYEEVILEALSKTKQVLTEVVSMSDVEKAIDGKYNVKIKYKDSETQLPTDRYIQVYNLSKTKAGNLAIRAYQISGGSTSNEKQGFWKIFRLDKIDSWEPTKVRWQQPVSNFDTRIPKYNKNGDRTMASVIHKVNVDEPISKTIAKTPQIKTTEPIKNPVIPNEKIIEPKNK